MPKKETEAILLQVACYSEEEARILADTLLHSRLVAAAQISPMKSLYWWQGERYEEPEWMMACLTVKSRYREIEEVVQKQHSYQMPEIIGLPIVCTPSEFRSWIEEYSNGKSKD